MFWHGGRTTSFVPRVLPTKLFTIGYWIRSNVVYLLVVQNRFGTQPIVTVQCLTAFLPRQCRVDACALARWTHSAFRAYGVSHAGSPPSAIAGSNGLHPSLVSDINQWSPCSVSPHSDPAVLYRCPCPSPMDAQRLSRLRRFLRWLSSISDCWIEWFTPFAGIRYSTNGHRTVFYRILPRQSRVDAHALARWMHSAFRAFAFPTQALFHQWLLDRITYVFHKYPTSTNGHRAVFL